MNEVSLKYSQYISLDNAVNLTFFLIIIGYVIYSIILYYHWKSYSTDIRITSMTLITYFSTTIPLVIIAAILALII